MSAEREGRGAKTGLLGREMVTGDFRGGERGKEIKGMRKSGKDVERCNDGRKLLQ